MRAIKRLIFFTFFIAFCVNLSFANYEQSSIGDWNLVKYTDSKGSKYCYIFSEPQRTRATLQESEGRHIVISNNNGYATIGVSSNFELDTKKGFILTVNNKHHLLNITALSQAQTYTSYQDVSIINDLIMESDFFKIRSYSVDDKTALDYYSVRGLTTSLQQLMSCY